MNTKYLLAVIIVLCVTIAGCISRGRHEPLNLAGLESDDYRTRRTVLTELYNRGQTESFNKETIEYLIAYYGREKDWRLKVRALLVIGRRAKDKEQVIPFLIEILSYRDKETNGLGVVPTFATLVLSEIGDVRVILPIQDWIRYLQTHPYQDQDNEEYSETLIDQNIGYLIKLEERIKPYSQKTHSSLPLR